MRAAGVAALAATDVFWDSVPMGSLWRRLLRFLAARQFAEWEREFLSRKVTIEDYLGEACEGLCSDAQRRVCQLSALARSDLPGHRGIVQRLLGELRDDVLSGRDDPTELLLAEHRRLAEALARCVARGGEEEALLGIELIPHLPTLERVRDLRDLRLACSDETPRLTAELVNVYEGEYRRGDLDPRTGEGKYVLEWVSGLLESSAPHVATRAFDLLVCLPDPGVPPLLVRHVRAMLASDPALAKRWVDAIVRECERSPGMPERWRPYLLRLEAEYPGLRPLSER